jgi:predicted esterase
MKFLVLFIFLTQSLVADYPDIRTIPQNLFIPELLDQKPEAGKRVKVQLSEFKGTKLYHTIYLPKNWKAGKKYSVIVEYAGNGPYKNKYGDVSSGKVEGSVLGYGISEGNDFIWVCLPYVNEKHNANQTQWWGDVKATVEYCKKAVKETCKKYGGDEKNLILCGFSRGAIACNYIGLHDDEIASLWKGFICYSHYDGVRNWKYAASDKKSAKARLMRLKGRPQYIIHEQSVDATKKYLASTKVDGDFTMRTLPFRNHNASWVLRKTKEVKELRLWLKKQIALN